MHIKIIKISKLLVILIIGITGALSSCCLVTSADCNCDPGPAFNDIRAIAWCGAQEHNQLKFNSKNTMPQLDIFINEEFKIKQEFIGGEECGVMNDVFIKNYLIDDLAFLHFQIRAVQDRVEFIFVDNKDEYYLGNLEVEKLKFNGFFHNTGTLSDTLIGTIRKNLLTLRVSGEGNLSISQIQILEDTGLIFYLDTFGVMYERK